MKMHVLKVIALVAMFPFVTACQLLGSELDKAAKAGGKLVVFYCDNVTSEDLRIQLRDAVNKYAAPNSVAVTCANGTHPVLDSAAASP